MLGSVADSSGAHAQASCESAIATKSAGDVWLQNEAGMIMHLKAKCTAPIAGNGASKSACDPKRRC